MINQVGQSDYFWWSIMKSQQKTFLKTVKPPVQISQRNGCTCILLYMYLITGIWPWRLRWLSRWWTRAVFWNYTRRVQRWTNCKSDTNDIIVSLCIIKLVWLSSSSSSPAPAPAPAPRRLTNTFWLVQPLWQLPSSSTLLCFTLFFVLVKVWEILDIGQCVLCQSLFKQKHSAIVSLTKLSTNWCFLVEQSWWDRSIHLTPSGANQNGLKIHFISSCHIHVVSHFTHVACIYANVWEQKKLFT